MIMILQKYIACNFGFKIFQTKGRIFVIENDQIFCVKHLLLKSSGDHDSNNCVRTSSNDEYNYYYHKLKNVANLTNLDNTTAPDHTPLLLDVYTALSCVWYHSL